MDTPIRPTLMTLPVELVLSIADQIDNWYDIRSLMRAYQASGKLNTDTTRRFQKLMFRTDARKYKESINVRHGEYYWRDLIPPITATHWAILMGDVEVALLAMEEHRVQGNKGYLYVSGWSGFITVNLSHFNNPHKNMTKFWHPTPVILAVLSGNIDMVKAIVDRCLVEEDEKMWVLNDWREMTILFKPCVKCKVTALDLAAWQGRKDMVKLLTDKGAGVGGRHPDKGDRIKGTIGLVAALCDWGSDLHISEEQLSGRVAVLEFLLDQGYEINTDGHSFQGRIRYGDVRNIPWWVLPYPFTPLWYTIWAMKPEYLGLAQLLIRRGAMWAPWVDADMNWWRPRESIYNPSCKGTSQISPLEGVLHGTEYKRWRAKEEEEAWTDVEESYDTGVTTDDIIIEKKVDNNGDGMTPQPDEKKLQMQATSSIQ